MSLENPFTVLETRLSAIEAKLDVMSNSSLPLPKLPDRIDFEEARRVLGTEEKPVSKAFLYNETHKGTIPHECFGRRLIFSRKKLIEWRDARTAEKVFPDAVIIGRLAESASKKLAK